MWCHHHLKEALLLPVMPSPNAQDVIPRKQHLSERRESSPNPTYTPKSSIRFLATLIAFLTLLQIQTPIRGINGLLEPARAKPRRHDDHEDGITFLPLKDLQFAKTPMDGNTWFMSSLNDTFEEGETEYLHFPSEATSENRLLCLAGGDASNGTMNSYALAPVEALPRDARLLSGLTFVSDTYYDYDNLWHGLSAAVPFVAWHGRKGCVRPARWVLYHWGELRTNISPWLRTLMRAVFGREVEIERREKSDQGPSCFEEAVVFRHNEGKMARERREKVYDMMRCKARAYCNVTTEAAGDSKAVRLTLLLRTGARSFKDETAVIEIFQRECRKVAGCRLKVSRPNNLTFCDQARLMSETDILASPHGAQLTNMFLMDKNSSVMEFFPKGWLELAGVGQHVYRWIAAWSGMQHQGRWNDPQGDRCPYSETSRCFPFYKNRKIGHDEGFFAGWAARVLREVREHKHGEGASRRDTHTETTESSCGCD